MAGNRYIRYGAEDHLFAGERMGLKSITLLPVIEEIAKIGCYETDMATGTWIGSDNFIEIFGLEKKPFYTVAEFQALVHPDDFEWVMAYFSECLEKKIDFDCEYRCVKKNGETIYVNSRSKIYYKPDGTPERVLGIKQDVTLSKQNERRLCQLNENNIKKNEILSVVAHDLKSPLSQLQALAQLMKMELGNQFEDIMSMHENICKSAQEIVREIVEIAELEDEAYTLKTALTDINKLISEVVKHFRLIANEKKITVTTKLAEECIAVVNEEKFSRMITNLLSNALKFTPDHRTVELSTENVQGKIIIRIKDEGIGIKKEFVPVLFDKFSNTVRRPGTKGEKSTGLGLNIVKKICDLHGGTIAVESRENVGTTFTLKFPRYRYDTFLQPDAKDIRHSTGV